MQRNLVSVTALVDNEGNPTGGGAEGVGLSIQWQDGVVKDGVPNGAFIQDLIGVCIERLRFYQQAADGKLACRQNAIAITKLEEALFWLDDRVREREGRGVQGTYNP